LTWAASINYIDSETLTPKSLPTCGYRGNPHAAERLLLDMFIRGTGAGRAIDLMLLEMSEIGKPRREFDYNVIQLEREFEKT
jgi:hypothetical protein